MMSRSHSSTGWLLLVLALVGVLPFVLLSMYAHPSADDWYMAADTLEKGFWRANVDYYLGLTGRFFSSALLFMNPIMLSFTWFKVYSMLLVLALPVSMRWAAAAWFPEAGRTWHWLLAVMSGVLFLWGMASPAQGFYWGTGSAGYTLPGVLSLGLAGLLGCSCLDLDWTPGRGRLIAAMLLALAITGCSEVAMALLLAHVCMLNACFIWRHRRVSRALLLVLASTCLGVAVVVLTPGNAVRQTWYSNDVQHALVPALLMALKLAVRQIGIWMIYLPLPLFSAAAVVAWPESLRMSRPSAWECIVAAVILMTGGICGGFFLGAWSMGAVIPQRAVNLLLLFFIIDWVLLLAGLVGLLRGLDLRLPRPGLLPALGALVVFCGCTILMKNNVKQAWRDLVSGRAALYDQESARRHELIRLSLEPDVLVPALSARPATIFFNDLTADPANWRNTGCARFFRRHSVALKP